MAKSCCKNCAPAVTQLAGTARVPTGKRRPFAALAKPNSTTAISCSDYRMAIAAFIPQCRPSASTGTMRRQSSTT
jgi:hypothetical protein